MTWRPALVLGVAVAVTLSAWKLRDYRSEKQRSSARLAYRNGLVVAEMARVQTLLRRSPPHTIADVTKIVGSPSVLCNDKNEPGPLDDPRAERCPVGSACHGAFYMVDWYVRRRIERPDTRVWFDPKLDGDNSSGKLRIHVSGCEPGASVLEAVELDPVRFSVTDW